MAKTTALSTITDYQVIKYDDPSKPLRQHREELIEELVKKLNVCFVNGHGRARLELQKLDGEDESVRNLRQYAWNLYTNNIKRFKNEMEIYGWVNPYIDIEYETQVITRVLRALDDPQDQENRQQLTLLAKSMPGHTPDELRLKRNIFAILAVAGCCCSLASLFTFGAALIGPSPFVALLVAGIILTLVNELVALDSAKRADDKESFTTNLSLFSKHHAKMVDSQANSAENEGGSTEEDPIPKAPGF